MSPSNSFYDPFQVSSRHDVSNPDNLEIVPPDDRADLQSRLNQLRNCQGTAGPQSCE